MLHSLTLRLDFYLLITVILKMLTRSFIAVSIVLCHCSQFLHNHTVCIQSRHEFWYYVLMISPSNLHLIIEKSSTSFSSGGSSLLTLLSSTLPTFGPLLNRSCNGNGDRTYTIVVALRGKRQRWLATSSKGNVSANSEQAEMSITDLARATCTDKFHSVLLSFLPIRLFPLN